MLEGASVKANWSITNFRSGSIAAVKKAIVPGSALKSFYFFQSGLIEFGRFACKVGGKQKIKTILGPLFICAKGVCLNGARIVYYIREI